VPEIDNGMPKSTARHAAREKFRTVVTDITVEEKQRLKDFRSSGNDD